MFAFCSTRKSVRRSFRRITRLWTQPGDFAENIVIAGIDLIQMRIGDKIIINDTVILEITQIGKECHSGCAIQQITGECIMPREGIFARVLQGGKIEKGNKVII